MGGSGEGKRLLGPHTHQAYNTPSRNFHSALQGARCLTTKVTYHKSYSES